MIHFLTWLPLPYQQTLCREIGSHYGSQFLVWFGEANHEQFPYKSNLVEGFSSRYLDIEGYWPLLKALLADEEAVVILGGWRSPMSFRTLIITTLLRVPVFIWADHPTPRKRNIVFRLLRNLYLRLLDKLATGFLACGKPTLEHLASLGLARGKIWLFPYWVDLRSNWSLPPGSRDDSLSEPRPLKLISVGRLFPVKQVSVAIEALSDANRTAGYRMAELVIAGDGPERSSLERLAQSLSCLDCVSFLGWLEGDEVREEIEKSDLLVITSSFEPYGVVVLEAMAAGRPVLASDGVVAAVDRDEGSSAVFFHRVGDAQGLAEQIARFAKDRKSLHRSAIAARSTAEKWPPSLALQILNQILEVTGAGRSLIGRMNSSTSSTAPSENSVRLRV